MRKMQKSGMSKWCLISLFAVFCLLSAAGPSNSQEWESADSIRLIPLPEPSEPLTPLTGFQNAQTSHSSDIRVSPLAERLQQLKPGSRNRQTAGPGTAARRDSATSRAKLLASQPNSIPPRRTFKKNPSAPRSDLQSHNFDQTSLHRHTVLHRHLEPGSGCERNFFHYLFCQRDGLLRKRERPCRPGGATIRCRENSYN